MYLGGNILPMMCWLRQKYTGQSTFVFHLLKLRRFARLRFIHSHSDAISFVLPICRVVYFRCEAGASSKIDVRRLKVGELLIKIFVHCSIMSGSPCSRSVVISVPVTRQRRNLERIQCV